MDKTVAVEREPLAHVLGREGIIIIGIVVARPGIESCPAKFSDEAVVFVGDGILAGTDAQTVDVTLDGLAACFIARLCQQLVLGGDAVKVDLLSLIVDGADGVGALEHDMFEIVSDARIGTVAGSSFHHDGTIDLGLCVVFVEPHLQAVFQHHLRDTERLRELCPQASCHEQQCREQNESMVCFHLSSGFLFTHPKDIEESSYRQAWTSVPMSSPSMTFFRLPTMSMLKT